VLLAQASVESSVVEATCFCAPLIQLANGSSVDIGQYPAHSDQVTFDELVAARLGVNRTDLRCVEILMAQRTASPGELGPALGLTTGGVTAEVELLTGFLRAVRELYEGNLERVSGLD